MKLQSEQDSSNAALCRCPRLADAQLALFKDMLAGPHQLRSAVVRVLATVYLSKTKAAAEAEAGGAPVAAAGNTGEGVEDGAPKEPGSPILLLIVERALRDDSAFTRKDATQVCTPCHDNCWPLCGRRAVRPVSDMICTQRLHGGCVAATRLHC